MIYLLKKISKKRTNIRSLIKFSKKEICDFLFFICFLIESVLLNNLTKKTIKKYINIINYISLKYIYCLYGSNKFNLNSIHIEKFMLYINKKYLFRSSLNLKNNKIYQKLLLCKKVSKTKEKGRINRYKVILIVYNKKGWFGIGTSKNFYLYKAISKARLNAVKNIYFNILLFSNRLIKEYSTIFSNKSLLVCNRTDGVLPSSLSCIRHIMFPSRSLNITIKKVGSINMIKLLNLILH